MRNAFSCGCLAKVKPCIGWLETASREGLERMDEILKRKEFDQIRDSEDFKNFLFKNRS